MLQRLRGAARWDGDLVTCLCAGYACQDNLGKAVHGLRRKGEEYRSPQTLLRSMLVWSSPFHLKFASLIARADTFLWARSALRRTLSPRLLCRAGRAGARIHFVSQ